MGEDKDRKDKEREKDKEKERAKEREKDRDKEKQKAADAAKKKGDKADKGSKPAAAPASSPAVPAKTAKAPAGRSADSGLSDEALTQVAQAKFDAQEDRLRDVARHTITLLRDAGKFNSEADFSKKVTEIQKVLLKYETQYIRAWEYQERRRKREVEDLEREAARCRSEAEEEGAKIVELREILEKEKQRRKRYERYEELAEAVCSKKARTESQADIDACRVEIAETKRRRKELEAFVEQRQLKAQLLSHAVAELRGDLKREQELFGQADVAEAGEAEEPAGEQDPVEVIA